MTDLEVKTLDLGSSLFTAAVANDEILDAYFRGFLSEKEVGERFSFLRMLSLTTADRQLTGQEAETQYENHQ